MTRTKKPSGHKLGKPRPVRSLQRRQGHKRPGKVILIVCEGEKTEPIYFDALKRDVRLPSLGIRIIPDQGSPISIVKRAIREKTELSPGDKVWCVFDVEQENKNETFPKAVSLAKKSGINLAVSNPAFEYWYLLHFRRTGRVFMNAREVITQLKKYLPKYEKNIDVYPDLKDKTNAAIKNAFELRTLSPDDRGDYPNSSTNVDILASEILAT